MNQTPAHDRFNPDLLALMPTTARRIVEVGCMRGALAREYRAINPAAEIIGIDIDPDYVRIAAQHCTQVIASNIEHMPDDEFEALSPSDCWVFGDCLEHLHDPWAVLKRVRQAIDPDGTLMICLPNAQHWSVQWRLISGNFRYEDKGLMDRTHIRWFTRTTMLEMFASTGWQIQQGLARMSSSPDEQAHLAAIRAYAVAAGIDPDVAEQDAQPFQYVFRLTPQ